VIFAGSISTVSEEKPAILALIGCEDPMPPRPAVSIQRPRGSASPKCTRLTARNSS
jgi:hypothetical protein